MISVIIPTFNEAAHIESTINNLLRNDKNCLISEIIITDGGSTDDTISIANSIGAKVVVSPKKGRAAQMNYGASFATENILYFIHADSIPPENFTHYILNSIESGFGAGCFILSFDYNHWLLKANCWFTRFNIDAIRFGDQSLFVRKEHFSKVGGYSEQHIVMEDQYIVIQLKKICRFAIIKKPILTSARKYLENGIYKTKATFYLIYLMYRLGYSQKKLVTTYRKLIWQNKI